MKINLISVDNGVGLSRDVAILRSILEPYHEVNFIDIYKRKNIQRADINIFLEVYSNLTVLARINIFIPNPEWFDIRWKKEMLKMDLVLAKTRDCERIFKRITKKTKWIGFTSLDRHINVSKDKIFIHTAGKSQTKGTREVYQCWKNHNLGKIIITGETKLMPKSNIVICRQRLNEEDFMLLQNSCLFHVCPSNYEGFGHYINEAKSMGAIIVTTNAQPMTELVEKEYGYYVPVSRQSNMGLARISHINPDDLYDVVRHLSKLTDAEIELKSKKSRESFLKNDKRFRRDFLKTINEYERANSRNRREKV